MRAALYIFVGGGLGSLARFVLGNWISRIYPHPFPLGTLTVNVIACLLVGLFAGLLAQRADNVTFRFFLVTGFCGGFSTFSALTLDSATLFNEGLSGQMALYILLSLLLCMAATFLGTWLAMR